MGTASGALTLVPVYQRPGACGAHFAFDKHRLNIAKNRIKLYWLEHYYNNLTDRVSAIGGDIKMMKTTAIATLHHWFINLFGSNRWFAAVSRNLDDILVNLSKLLIGIIKMINGCTQTIA